jgi:UDP-N-acetylmuramate: L-alanyl-gamma-D-glutamyl-meso-diaminopimelate ligase
MLAWILERAGLAPGFLIGGVPLDFGVSARLGERTFFVVEADEYDTAFFDKRSKFVHYRPRTLVLNNLEHDHADIFPDLAAIQRQFHHLVRTVPGTGRIIRPAADAALSEVLAMGCWTPVESTGPGGDWEARALAEDGSHFEVACQGQAVGEVRWPLLGAHNVANGLAAVAAARHAGVDPGVACEALGAFRNVRRRLEPRGRVRGVTVYDDFAHHPTAIRVTLEGLRRHVGRARVVAVLEPRSNTMRLGVHRDQLAGALEEADLSLVYAPPDLGWDVASAVRPLGERARVRDSLGAIILDVTRWVGPGDHVVLMSNGSFGGLHDRLLAALEE